MFIFPQWTSVFHGTTLPDFNYETVKGSFNKDKREIYDKYVFEQILRIIDLKKVCIPSSERVGEVVIHLPKVK